MKEYSVYVEGVEQYTSIFAASQKDAEAMAEEKYPGADVRVVGTIDCPLYE